MVPWLALHAFVFSNSIGICVLISSPWLSNPEKLKKKERNITGSHVHLCMAKSVILFCSTGNTRSLHKDTARHTNMLRNNELFQSLSLSALHCMIIQICLCHFIKLVGYQNHIKLYSNQAVSITKTCSKLLGRQIIMLILVLVCGQSLFLHLQYPMLINSI